MYVKLGGTPFAHQLAVGNSENLNGSTDHH